MSGDVTAAIERLRKAYGSASTGPWSAIGLPVPVANSTLTIHADGANLPRWSGQAPEVGSAVLKQDAEFMVAAYNDLPRVLAEVERLRADLALVDRHRIECEVENESLRAEREALRSAGTRERLVALLSLNPFGARTLHERQATAIVDAVLSVLTADPEAGDGGA